MYYKATSPQGDRKLFKKLRPACEFAGVSYFATRNALLAGKPTDKVQEVEKVKEIPRLKVEEIVKCWIEENKDVYTHMEPDGSILFV